MPTQTTSPRFSFLTIIPELQLQITQFLDFPTKAALLESNILPPETIIRPSQIGSHDSNGDTLLHICAQENYIHTTQYLLSAGAPASPIIDCRYRHDPQETPFLIACRRGNLAIAHLLLDHGANIDEWHDSGVTALHHASEHGHTDIVKLLLGKGAQQTNNFDVGAPIHLAATSGHADIIRLLVAHGADITAKRRGMNPLWLAIYNGRANCVRAILEAGAPLDGNDCGLGYCPPLLVAAGGRSWYRAYDIAVERHVGEIGEAERLVWELGRLESSVEMVRVLVEFGADVSDGFEGVTALHIAAIGGNCEAVEVLLGAGVDVNLRTEKGRSAYMFAKLLGYDDIVEVLERAKGRQLGERKPTVPPKPGSLANHGQGRGVLTRLV